MNPGYPHDPPVAIDHMRLRSRLNELQQPNELFAAIAGITILEAERFTTTPCQVNLSVAQRLARAVNVSVEYLAGAAIPNVPPPVTAPPVINPADHMAAAHHAQPAAAPQPQFQAQPVAPAPLAVETPQAAAMPMAAQDAPRFDALIRGKMLMMPGELFSFATRHRIEPAVAMLVDKLATIIEERLPGLGRHLRAQPDAYFASLVPAAFSIAAASLANEVDPFPTNDLPGT